MRLLSRTPIFTAVAILSLALGIGASAAIFQLIGERMIAWLAGVITRIGILVKL